MSPLSVLLSTLGLAFAWQAPSDQGKTLMGEWSLVKGEVGGEPFPEAVRKSLRLILTTGRYEVRSGPVPDKGTYKLDQVPSPNRITIVGDEGPNKGRTFPAIYELKGGKLRICYDLSGMQPPKKFESPKGSRLFLAVYTRLKPNDVQISQSANTEIGSALNNAERSEALDFHNRVRMEVGAPPLVWSSELSKYAQAWADRLASEGKLEHRPRSGDWEQKYGENLAIHSSVIKGVQAWYEEVKDYHPGDPIPESFASFKAGHYTQMVWSKSKRIGIGKVILKVGPYMGQTLIVANYDPPGNYLGEKPY